MQRNINIHTLNKSEFARWSAAASANTTKTSRVVPIAAVWSSWVMRGALENLKRADSERAKCEVRWKLQAGEWPTQRILLHDEERVLRAGRVLDEGGVFLTVSRAKSSGLCVYGSCSS